MTKESSMQTIHLTPTECTPAVEFDFAAQRFSLRGESWPENAAAFIARCKVHWNPGNRRPAS